MLWQMVTEGLSSLIMQFAGMQGWEWVIIIGLIVVVFFGVKKIPELAKSFGKATAEFEKARIQAKRELQQMKSEGNVNVGREKLESIADSLGIDYTNKNDDELRAAIDVELNKSKQ
jgi:sec-independent protein translocase protein TatA